MTTYQTGPVTRRGPVNGVTWVTSSPIPLHTVRVQAMKSGAFSIQLVSVFPAGQRAFYDTGERAFAAASRLVNARTFSDMKTRFSGPQRYAMGHQKCPYAMYGKLCNSPAGVGTVWCPGHPNGRTADV